MNEIAFFSVLILTLLRITGIFVAIDFLLRKGHKKERKFYLYLFGWISWLFGSFFSLISLMSNELKFKTELTLYHDLMILIGSTFIIFAIISCFKPVSKNFITFSGSIGALLPLFTSYFINDSLAKLAIIGLYFVLFSYLFINTWIERQNLKFIISNSKNWFYISILFCFTYAVFLIIMVINGEVADLGLLEDRIILIIYSLLSMSITLLVLVLTIHLEYSLINIQKFKMKDNFSHELGNLLHMILNAAELNFESPKKASLSLNELIIKKCHEAQFLITQIREI